MGLFRKKKNDEAEDFILDFGSASATPDSEEYEEELNITLWDDRKPHRPSHAMTVSEILGNSTEDNTDESEKTAPVETEEVSDKQEESTEVVAAEDNSATTETAAEENSSIWEGSKTYERGAKIAAPKDSAPTISAQGDHVETDSVVKNINIPPEIKINADNDKSAAERADELINRLKKENELHSAEETAVSHADPQPEEDQPMALEEAQPEVKEESDTADKKTEEESLTQPVAQEEAKAEEVKDTPENVAAEVPEHTPQKKESKLSPTAQALYDRMMAERAKTQSANATAKSTPNIEAVENEAPRTAEEKTEISLDFQSEDITATSDILPEPISSDTTKKSENIADAIFDSLNESMGSNNPLSRKMERSAESLLSKCKSYVTPTSDIDLTHRTIDDIIHSAEQGARERLSNLYEIQNSEPAISHTGTHEFSPFIQKTTLGTDGKPVSIPVKIQDETSDGAIISSTSGNITDFQCSFADSSDSMDSGTTRIIDIKSSSDAPHVTDPVRAEVLHDLLKPLAEVEEEEEAPALKFGVTDEVELPETEIAKTGIPVPEVEDYTSVEDVESIRTDLASQQLSIVARLIPTAVITLILAIVNIFLKEALLASSPTAFALLNIVLSAVALVINFRTLKGLASLLSGLPNIDSPTALSAVCTFLYTVISSISGNLATVPLLAPASMLILSFNLWGKLSIIKRIRRGFEVIANDREKKALTFVEDKYSASVMASGGVIGDALICQGKKTTNIRDYLKNAFAEDAYEKKVSPLLLFTVIAAAIAALLAFFVNDGVLPAIAAFTAVSLAGCPIAAIFSCNLPLSLASKKLSGYGAMLAGHDSAEAIANANAVAFDAADLFPKGTIKLYNMQVLESGAVDKYIASASAVLSAAGSPLAPVFEEILETNNEEIPVADSIKYENNMGVSGWIEDRRIFVGNRTLMEGHNIKTPSLELDKKILRQGYFPLYLACDQQLCALFVVGYEADEEITYELRNLCNTGVTMLVNSNDPNVSEEMLCDYFGLYPDSIKVMTGTGVAAYKTVGEYKENASAPASYSDNISGFLSTVTSSIRMKSIVTTLLIIQLALLVLGIVLTGYSIFTTGIMSLPLLGILGFQLAGALITSLVAHLRQP